MKKPRTMQGPWICRNLSASPIRRDNRIGEAVVDPRRDHVDVLMEDAFVVVDRSDKPCDRTNYSG